MQEPKKGGRELGTGLEGTRHAVSFEENKVNAINRMVNRHSSVPKPETAWQGQ
jgi:hypothetical protein